MDNTNGTPDKIILVFLAGALVQHDGNQAMAFLTNKDEFAAMVDNIQQDLERLTDENVFVLNLTPSEWRLEARKEAPETVAQYWKQS